MNRTVKYTAENIIFCLRLNLIIQPIVLYIIYRGIYLFLFF